ncbi:MAG TPA: OsmC family protein [Rhizomicrobium sp.]|jgi:putative redox protein|nr:OsmC family protein [Rhizomicrobium sp.]
MSEQHGGTRLVGRARASLAAARYAVNIRAGHHDLVADESVAAGGADAGASPFTLVLAGLGACTAITLRMYAEHKTWPLTGLGVDLEYFRDDKTFRIERVLHIEGPLDDAQRARLADIAERTPVTLALRAGTTINTKLA